MYAIGDPVVIAIDVEKFFSTVLPKSLLRRKWIKGIRTFRLFDEKF